MSERAKPDVANSMVGANDTAEHEALTDKQRRVLAAAMEVFAERGYAAASTAEIARRAGVAEGTVFKTYKTKKDLLLGVVAPFFARTIAPALLQEVIDVMRAPHATVEDFLRALYANRLAFIRRHERVVRIAMQELPFHDEVRALGKQVLGETVLPHALATVERFQRLGQIRTDADPTSVVRLAVGTFMTYTVTRVLLLPERTWDDAREIDLMVHVVARGLRP